MNFLINAAEMKVFIGANYIIAVKQLSSITIYSSCTHFVGNIGIQNIFTRTRCQRILQNLQFAEDTLLTTQKKIIQIKAIRSDQSSITRMNN